MCKPDSAYPCYGHECYDSGNYHVSCPSCPFYKTVMSEKNKNAKNLTDTEWRRRILKDIENQAYEDSTEDIIEFERTVHAGDPNPNTGVIYDLENLIAEYLENHKGSMPVDTRSGGTINEYLFVSYEDLIGNIVDFTDTTVKVRLVKRGIELRDRGFFDGATIQFCFVADPETDQVISIAKASVVFKEDQV